VSPAPSIVPTAHRSSADLPLHTGSAPRWLCERTERLGCAIAGAVVEEHGRAELVARLADPDWFQALGCALGSDWHSSGLTTTRMGALKAAIDPQELGVAVVGGTGATSRKNPTRSRQRRVPARVAHATTWSGPVA